jgi:glutathione S-transferase
MDGRGEPRPQPIGMLPTIARLIDQGLTDTTEQYETLLKARPKPWVLDDATINRSKRVNGEALEWCGVYDQQLKRWLGQRLTPAQRREVIRLQDVQRDQRRVLNEILALLEELAANTIDRQLAKSDAQLGLEYLLGFGPPLPPRHPKT